MIRVNALVLFCAGGLVSLGLRWAGYDAALNVIVTVGMIVFVVMMVYPRIRHKSS